MNDGTGDASKVQDAIIQSTLCGTDTRTLHTAALGQMLRHSKDTDGLKA